LKRLITLLSLIAALVLVGCGGDGGGGVDGVTGTQMGGSIQGTPLSLSGAVSTFAGLSLTGSQDGTGAAARFSLPFGITTDGTKLYVTDSQNNTIRVID
jgi:DNA-binding beta-propeller fold protein YncE